MSADYTVDVIRTIRRNAGKLPPEQIAASLGWLLPRLERVAAQHQISLRIPVADERREDTPVPMSDYFASRARLPAGEARSATFTVCMRPSTGKVLRDKAASRFVKPGRLLVDIFEAAVMRGWVDELAGVARGQRSPESEDVT